MAKWTSRARRRRSFATYGFLAAILPYTYAEWEKALHLPDFPWFPSCRPLRKMTCRREFWKPSTWTATGWRSRRCRTSSFRTRTRRSGRSQPMVEDRSRSRRWTGSRIIIRDFNDHFGNIEWKDQDKIEKVIAEELPAKVAGDRAYQNAMANSDQQNARIEHDKALERAMTEHSVRPYRAVQAVQRQRFVPPVALPRWSSPLHTTNLPPGPSAPT